LLDYILNVFQQKAWGKLEVLSLILSTEKKKKKRRGIGGLCLLSKILRSRDWEDHGLRLAQAKSSLDPISTSKKLGVVVHTCYFSYGGSADRKIAVQAQPDKNARS
jgi:hypothetical protein